jgi:acetyltransferase-like isoleucine patch superfamily enzyme
MFHGTPPLDLPISQLVSFKALTNSPEFKLVSSTDRETLLRLGIEVSGLGSCSIYTTCQSKRIGRISIAASPESSITFLCDNLNSTGIFNASIRALGKDCAVVVAAPIVGITNISDLFLRRSGQTLFWGAGATCVGASIEMEGAESKVLIGDDCMISSGVWIRNHDMHTMFDLRTNEIINPPPSTLVLEQHVWVGQDALLLGVATVGYGSIIGAKSLLKTSVPSCSMWAGTPARLLRDNVSWCRSVRGISSQTKQRLSDLDSINASLQS